MLPLLEFVHALIKSTQLKDVYVCNMMAAIKDNMLMCHLHDVL
jgi:hypothetical protein